MYVIHIPAAPLRGFIECYWFLEGSIPPSEQLEETIFTDGRADIVFSCDSPYQRQRESGVETMPFSNLDAQRPYPVRITQYGQVRLAGVRFRPGGLAAFLPVPVHTLDGLTLSLGDSFGRSCEALEARLFAPRSSREDQAALLDHFFLQRLAVPVRHALVRRAAAVIEQRRGVIKMGQLSRDFGYSQRMLDRMFLEVMGYTPKFYARVVRFHHALSALVHNQGVDWSDVVADGGYYDQAHFIKEFVAFSGLQPEAYRARLNQQIRITAPNYVQFLQEKSAPAG